MAVGVDSLSLAVYAYTGEFEYTTHGVNVRLVRCGKVWLSFMPNCSAESL